MGLSPEQWRRTVWSSPSVRRLAETVRRPRPSRLILPDLLTRDIDVRGEELDQLAREVEVLLAHVDELVAALDIDGDRFLSSLRSLTKAVETARGVPSGGVAIG